MEGKYKTKLSMRVEFRISFKEFSKVKKLGLAMGRPLCYTKKAVKVGTYADFQDGAGMKRKVP
ncbi:MAG TPA: hypothetical protein IAB31_10320 [Candidatus Choladousia intestinavium]|uniref:Uncharacterized protein n=1 Tax=Candidatus Choladousia intestinavium TaxID=2840727 RepID=A0A9D1ADS8_9FIRM|nr:hypothetical protein [Candidatus Choladousia intestinavium]